MKLCDLLEKVDEYCSANIWAYGSHRDQEFLVATCSHGGSVDARFYESRVVSIACLEARVLDVEIDYILPDEEVEKYSM